jgi:hypothetical protein
MISGGKKLYLRDVIHENGNDMEISLKVREGTASNIYLIDLGYVDDQDDELAEVNDDNNMRK